MLIVEGESPAAGMLFQAARRYEWNPWGRCSGSFSKASRGETPRCARSAGIAGLSLCCWVCDCPLFCVPPESPPERCGQRRSMPSGIAEKNPSMEPAATTPFRVTVSVCSSAQLGDPPEKLGGCQRGEKPAHPGRGVLSVKLAGGKWVLMCPGRAAGLQCSLEFHLGDFPGEVSLGSPGAACSCVHLELYSVCSPSSRGKISSRRTCH